MDRYPYHEYTILLGATRALAHIGVHFRHRVFGLSVINIKLVKAPLVMEYNAEHNTDGETERLVKINTLLLVKAFSRKASFILSNRAIEILFNAKNPFIAHYVLP